MDGTLIPALALCALCGPIGYLAGAPEPTSGQPILVISMNPEEIVHAANGNSFGPMSTRFSALAFGDDDLAMRLKQNGAWILTDGTWLARLCGGVLA